MKVKQPKLGDRGTLIFLVLISAFPPLTTDLYLPALPQMVDNFATSEAMVNMTLSTYFITYALGLLFWGSLSDKYGRKPIMYTGLGIYIFASILCAISMNVEILIASRMLQAFAGSAVTVVATSIVKDLYDGRQREKIMATIMSLVVIAPMVAPVLGAFLLKVASWRMMFVALAIFGAICAFIALFFVETLEEKYDGSIFRSWGRMCVVIRNPNFAALLSIFSLAPMAMLSFLAAASYIYVNEFGLTEQEFSFIFGFNALCATFGPVIYIKLSKRFSVQNIVTAAFLLTMICGIIVATIGHTSMWLFASMIAPITLSTITMRIPGMNLMLEQQKGDTGSAAALIQFCGMTMGSIGMVLVSIDPDNLIRSLGIIQAMVGLLAGSIWLIFRNRPFVKDTIAKMQD